MQREFDMWSGYGSLLNFSWLDKNRRGRQSGEASASNSAVAPSVAAPADAVAAPPPPPETARRRKWDASRTDKKRMSTGPVTLGDLKVHDGAQQIDDVASEQSSGQEVPLSAAAHMASAEEAADMASAEEAGSTIQPVDAERDDLAQAAASDPAEAYNAGLWDLGASHSMTPPTLRLREEDEVYLRQVLQTVGTDVLSEFSVRKLMAGEESDSSAESDGLARRAFSQDSLSDASSGPGDFESESESDSSDDCLDGQGAVGKTVNKNKARRSGSKNGPFWAEKGAAETGMTEELLHKDVYNRIKNNGSSIMGHFEFDVVDEDEQSSDDDEVQLRHYSADELRTRKQKEREKREKAAKKVCRRLPRFRRTACSVLRLRFPSFMHVPCSVYACAHRRCREPVANNASST